LALAVVFESGFQCYADRAEAYEELPRLPKQFLREVPAAWDESRLLAGYPSDYVIVARRKGKVWYIGGINGKNEARELEFTLPDTCKELISTWMTDGEDQDSFGYEVVSMVDGKVKVKLLANGGFAGIIR
jgi:alpha-glucosidase